MFFGVFFILFAFSCLDSLDKTYPHQNTIPLLSFSLSLFLSLSFSPHNTNKNIQKLVQGFVRPFSAHIDSTCSQQLVPKQGPLAGLLSICLGFYVHSVTLQPPPLRVDPCDPGCPLPSPPAAQKLFLSFLELLFFFGNRFWLLSVFWKSAERRKNTNTTPIPPSTKLDSPSIDDTLTKKQKREEHSQTKLNKQKKE